VVACQGKTKISPPVFQPPRRTVRMACHTVTTFTGKPASATIECNMCVPWCMPANCCMCWAGLWFRSGVCLPVRLAATPAERQRASGDVTLGPASFVIAGSLPAALKNEYITSEVAYGVPWHRFVATVTPTPKLSAVLLHGCKHHCCAHTLHCHKGLTFSHLVVAWRRVCWCAVHQQYLLRGTLLVQV
jgi:hypothetical protein